MTTIVWALLAGAIGAAIGFLLCSWLTMSKRTDEDERVKS